MTDCIEPITPAQQQQVVAQTRHFIELANREMGCRLRDIPVRFDLTGRAAGMYKVQRRQRMIRYNPYLMARYFEDGLNVTVPHEVAHYVVEQVHGRKVRPHGPEWKSVMTLFGVENQRATAPFDLAGIPQRRHRKFDYRCACRPHSVGARRHQNIQKGLAQYVCRHCGHILEKSSLAPK